MNGQVENKGPVRRPAPHWILFDRGRCPAPLVAPPAYLALVPNRVTTSVKGPVIVI